MIRWRLIFFLGFVGGRLTVGEGGWLTAVFFVRVDGWPSGCGRATDSSFFFSQGFRQWMTDATPICNSLQLFQRTQDWHIIF